MPAPESTRPSGRRWAKTEETRRQVLEAAADVFIEQGYTQAGISDVVERAGSSVGSVYHHFGGKAELYTALWEDYVARLARAAAGAVADMRNSGTTDPLAQFEAGTLAYLEAVWRDRRLFPIFYSGDAPPGFETLRRERSAEWVRRNLKVLGLGNSVEDRMTVASLTSLVGEAARFSAECKTVAQAKRVARHAVELIRRLNPGPD
ncbi:TetR/AcrR family transcriptional regulator [Aeromicrobium duanguangcaii]|uniref:TetR/AcrR family transcriptional regulator n=1 Tax=Aeromicrobium duanguangcaii TaxID=2968086 RepID=A0ABY5KD86_9ACTN|nr:TetR/AcrR family transcriptional regulator [Aeromicrobium duanguangcaii]MCD9154510.1 TetR/AcrR family transcriptional regulator [Aeromicrobium duanguangcaii]MCL3838258.1 TetR/AcrR family transcriptional regulator [Aeromicrobium duanguangcaii]UUI68434.1 TetR/AcrR family transcriptional regulator [Aeromicrobium duanguangcaii]